jgi:voltage-gated potassium channel
VGHVLYSRAQVSGSGRQGIRALIDAISNLWRRAARAVGGQRFLAIGLVVLSLIVGASIIMWLFEQGRNPNVHGAVDGFYWTTITMITGAPWKAVTRPGSVAYYMLLVVRPGLMALVTAGIASALVQVVLRRNMGHGRTRLKDHIVICGWSSKGNEIINEIRGRQDAEAERHFVILAPLKENPTKDERTTFISGDPASAEDLDRANISAAATAIILADNSYPGIDVEEMDSKTLMVALAVEAIAPDCYTCVEIIHSANRPHFLRTKVDELLISGKLTGALLAHSAATHGLSKVIDELVSYPGGNEFYWTDVTPALAGKQFHDALSYLKRNYEAVPVAVKVPGNKQFFVNPPSDYELKIGDHLLVICEEQPTFDQ